MAVIFTAAMVHNSRLFGRLIKPPSYDDCSYMLDAATRLRMVQTQGIVPFAARFFANPPHSPWSTLLGMASFMILGMRNWAPYAANSVLVFAYLTFADYLLRGLRLWKKIIGFLYLLAIDPQPGRGTGHQTRTAGQ
jgi:hypothetical protein